MFAFALGAVLLACTGLTPTASAATEAQKLAAILLGDVHLDAIQCNTAGPTFGSWSTSGCSGSYQDAFTGAAVFAFLSHQSKWPAGALATKYQTDVNNGITYLLTHASTSTVTTNNSSVNICPGGSGSCMAVYWTVCGESTYCTGLVAPAINTFALTLGANAVADANPVSVGHPLGGLTWRQIAQGITNAFAAGQATAVNGNRNGGWRYSVPSNTDADMSTTQWGAISSGYDEATGAVTPAVVKTNLKAYLAYDLSGGTACYTGSGGCGIGPTHSENGGWLTSNQYAGNAFAASVMSWLNTNWKTTPSGTWYGNFGHPYAMWAVYKGLESTIGLADNTHILNLNSTCGGPGNLPGPGSPSGGVCNWWEDYNEYLVHDQNVDGSWTDHGGDWPDPLNTSFFIAILDAAALPATITTPNPPSTVPALSVWGLVALGIMLAGFAAMRLRKAHAQRPV
jgi:hypothetical protein